VGHIRGTRPGLTPPQRGEYEYGDELPMQVGTSDSAETDLELEPDERHREKRARYERLRRKRPVGFAPWPEDA
jgi:hypothetical protein